MISLHERNAVFNGFSVKVKYILRDIIECRSIWKFFRPFVHGGTTQQYSTQPWKLLHGVFLGKKKTPSGACAPLCHADFISACRAKFLTWSDPWSDPWSNPVRSGPVRSGPVRSDPDVVEPSNHVTNSKGIGQWLSLMIILSLSGNLIIP